MLLEIDNFEQFKVFFDVVYDITELIELQLFPNHMTCTILDKSKTRFMTVEYKKDFFALYEIDDVESVTLFSEDIHKIIKSVSKIDNVVLETNENHLICRVESQNGNSRVFEFVLPMDSIESPYPPSLSLPISLDLNLTDIKQAIKDLKIIGSGEIQFTVDGDNLSITAGIETTTNYVLMIPLPENAEEIVYSRFTLAYIEELLKFEKINKTVELQLGQNYPLSYSFEDDIMGVKVQGIIAPRLEIE